MNKPAVQETDSTFGCQSFPEEFLREQRSFLQTRQPHVELTLDCSLL